MGWVGTGPPEQVDKAAAPSEHGWSWTGAGESCWEEMLVEREVSLSRAGLGGGFKEMSSSTSVLSMAHPGIIRVGKDLQSHQATLEVFDLNTKLNTDLV